MVMRSRDSKVTIVVFFLRLMRDLNRLGILLEPSDKIWPVTIPKEFALNF